MSDRAVRDLQACSRMVGDIIAERDILRTEVKALRDAQVLWEIRSVDNGGVMDRFVAPVGWTPGDAVQRFELAYDVRFFPVGQVSRLPTDEAVLAHCRNRK